MITCDLCKKRAQIFAVGGSFTPTKASVYLRTALYDQSNYWDLNDAPVISVANFLTKTENTTAQMYAGDDSANSGFDSKSYMISDDNGGATDWPALYYPIKTGIVGDFDVYIYYLGGSGGFNANILLDDEVVDTISDGVNLSWGWSSSGTITVGDTQAHTLGVQFNGPGSAALDKIIIQPSGDPAPGVVTFTDSPYNTVHAQLYSVTADSPDTALIIDDYKNTLNGINQDGWYNFDLNFLTTAGVTAFSDDEYALVLWAAGAREKNFISWELVESDEYLDLPVAAEE